MPAVTRLSCDSPQCWKLLSAQTYGTSSATRWRATFFWLLFAIINAAKSGQGNKDQGNQIFKATYPVIDNTLGEVFNTAVM